MKELEIKIGCTVELVAAADALRQEVFIDEQGVPYDEIFDGMNKDSVHFVIFDESTPIATARALNNNGSWRIGLVAVKKSSRGERLGNKVMHEVMNYIASCNGHEIFLTAQSTVRHFYERFGFEQDGDLISFESGFVLVPMKYRIKKHIVITGGANGIGRCIAEAFLREGADVTVIDIDIDKSAGDALQEAYANLRFFHGDIAEKETLERFVDSLSQPVDFLINNACIGRRGLLSHCSYEDFEYVQRVGVTAPYYLTSLLLQRELLAQNASIVNISSTRANQSQSDTEAYSAAKGGISALTHAMAVSLAGKARVNAINPGWIDTQVAWASNSPQGERPAAGSTFTGADAAQHPVGRVGIPSDIAEMVLFLCSEKAGFITGESIIIDGGMSRLMVYHGDHVSTFASQMHPSGGDRLVTARWELK